MEDARIISLLFKRDDAAIAALDDRYGALCRHLAGNLLSDPRDVEECVNDAWLAVWDRIPPERPDPLSAYLCRIVKKLAIARYHRNTAHKRNTAYDVSLDDLAECFPSSFSVEDEALARALSRRINHFLADLPAEELTLLVRDNYTAVLLVCDEDGGVPQTFYSAEGSLGGRLAVAGDGTLLWDVENISSTFLSLATDSFTVGGVSTVYRYTFDASGTLLSRTETGETVPFRR